MSQTRDLLQSLKKCLRARGYTYSDVASALRISEASVKRVFSEQTFSLQRLEEVCRFLDMSIYDLARMTRLGGDEDVTQLTLEQERGLARDPLVLTYFYLLLTGRTPTRIAKEFGLDARQQEVMLVRLSKLKLVELLPKNNGRLLTSRRIDWRRDGPIRKLYERQVQQEFMASGFAASDEAFRFDTGELTAASVSVLTRKLEKLSQEFDELVELDMSAPPNRKKSYGMMVGCRPWTFWHVLESTANDMGLNAARSQARHR